MSRVCQLTGTGPVTGSRIRRSGKAKKKGGIGMHITKVVKRRFLPNLQRVKAIKKGLVTKTPKRTWKKADAEAKPTTKLKGLERVPFFVPKREKPRIDTNGRKVKELNAGHQKSNMDGQDFFSSCTSWPSILNRKLATRIHEIRVPT